MAIGAAPRYLPAAVAAREQSRRRTLLWSIAALTLLSISPVLGHHVARGAETLLRGTDRIGELCLVALHALLAPVHGAFHVALVVGLAYAIWDRLVAARSARAALRRISATRPAHGDPFWLAARDVGMEPSIVRIVDHSPNPAFTIGWFRPRVYLSRALAYQLARDELRAVIAHEGAHVARRDPLRLATLRFFACTLFWIPALQRLAADVADEAEVLADDAAAGGAPLVLASAILSVATTPALAERRAPVAGASSFTCGDILERRIRRLAGEATQAATHVTRRSIVGAAATLLLVWVSGAIMAHPLPGEPGHNDPGSHAPRSGAYESHENCRSHREVAIAHLLCRRLELADGRVHCPHELHELMEARRSHG